MHPAIVKSTSSIALAAALCCQTAFADTVHARERSCASLTEQVQKEGQLRMKVFLGVLTVHASDQACDHFTHDAVRSVWRASDKICELGYTCDRKVTFSD